MTELNSTNIEKRIRLRRADDKALQAHAEKHQMIDAIGKIITSEINLDLLFQLIVKHISELTKSETCSIFLHDPDSNELWALVSGDFKKNSLRISTQCGIAGWVFENQIPQIINAPYDDPRFFQGADRKTGFRTKNMICIPLIDRQKSCIGTLQVLNKRTGFTAHDLEVLVSASRYVTIALENAKLYEDLKELDRIKLRVINHLSHELKTPLAIIKGSLELIRNKVSADEFRKIENALNRGAKNIERLKELQMKADDILLHFKGEETDPNTNPLDVILELIGHIEEENPSAKMVSLEQLKKRIKAMGKPGTIKKSVVSVSKVIENTCKSVLPIVGKRNICLMQHVNSEPFVYTDKNVLEKVCAGILKNAIENTPDEGHIEVSAQKDNKEIRIEIEDHGVGISRENQKMIFSGFYPTQETDKYSSGKPYNFNAGGTGIELYRIKVFSDKLNFKVDFTSQLCPVIEEKGFACPGRISLCKSITERSQCLQLGGSKFTVRFESM